MDSELAKGIVSLIVKTGTVVLVLFGGAAAGALGKITTIVWFKNKEEMIPIGGKNVTLFTIYKPVLNWIITILLGGVGLWLAYQLTHAAIRIELPGYAW